MSTDHLNSGSIEITPLQFWIYDFDLNYSLDLDRFCFMFLDWQLGGALDKTN